LVSTEREFMRILGLVFSFLVTVLLATLAFNYASARVATNRIAVQESWMSSSEAAEPAGYQAYGEGR
jgi:hypothetical protein